MKRSLFGLCAAVVVLGTGLSVSPYSGDTSGSSDLAVRWVDVNHLQLQVGERWEDVPLMPLAEHLCRGDDPVYERYCE